MDFLQKMANVAERLKSFAFRFDNNIFAFLSSGSPLAVAVKIATAITTIIWVVGAFYPLILVTDKIMALLAGFNQMQIATILILGTWVICFLSTLPILWLRSRKIPWLIIFAAAFFSLLSGVSIPMYCAAKESSFLFFGSLSVIGLGGFYWRWLRHPRMPQD